MNSFDLPIFKIGMIVITPAKDINNITEDKYYTILDIKEDTFKIKDDLGVIKYYPSYFFIEADVYYNMIMWLSLIRIFDINPKRFVITLFLKIIKLYFQNSLLYFPS